MSDFVITKRIKNYQNIYDTFNRVYGEKVDLKSFESKNLSLFYSENIYNGFKSFESETFIIIVLGGPVLRFRDNSFISNSTRDCNEGTKSIYERWIINNEMNWEFDIDGPYSIIFFDKKLESIKIVNDLLSTIPIYQKSDKSFTISSHINIIQSINSDFIDEVSLADYLLNNVITFPFTIFKNIKQIYPSSIHNWSFEKNKISYNFYNYWLPYELGENNLEEPYELIDRLTVALKSYVDLIINSNPKLAILMSGGEDSRSVAGSIPHDYIKDGYIYCVKENHEVRIARTISKILNINLKVGYIKSSQFVDTLKKVSNLIGLGFDSTNVHSYSFIKKFDIDKYDVVFGGFLADTFLKNLWKDHKNNNSFSEINEDVLHLVNERKKNHYELVSTFRIKTVKEWTGIWPLSMQRDIPNIYGNRRLFKNFEPFASNEIIKIGALASSNLKSNRNLFRPAMKPFIKKVKWIPHDSGFMPFFPAFLNKFLFKPFWRIYFKLTVGNNNTMTNWDIVFEKKENIKLAEFYIKMIDENCHNFFKNKSVNSLNIIDKFTNIQKRNLFHIGNFLDQKNK